MFICAGSSGTIDERTAYTERTRDLSMGRGEWRSDIAAISCAKYENSSKLLRSILLKYNSFEIKLVQ